MTNEAKENKRTYLQHLNGKLERDDTYPLFAVNAVQDLVGKSSFDLILPEGMDEKTVIEICGALLDGLRSQGKHLKMFQVN